MAHAQRAGVRIHYESFGRGTPIVLLHPMSANRYVWVHQIFAFARERRVIALDLRGHGLSDRPSGGYGIDSMAADLLAVLDDAGIDRAVLVGNSVGGMIAVETALVAPDRVLGMVIVSSGTHLAPSVPPEVRQAYTERFEAAFEYMLRGSTSARTKRERPEVCALLADLYRVRESFTPDVFLACMGDPNGVFHWDVTDRLEHIRAPVLVLTGQEDPAIPPEAPRLLAARIPGAQLKVVPDVGHFYPLERPADFNEDLRAFLEHIRV
jgi:pimeloyl-ACP methyl ester carboxylesterase